MRRFITPPSRFDPKSGEICNILKKVNFSSFFVNHSMFTLLQVWDGEFWNILEFFFELRALFLISFVKKLCFGAKNGLYLCFCCFVLWYCCFYLFFQETVQEKYSQLSKKRSKCSKFPPKQSSQTCKSVNI